MKIYFSIFLGICSCLLGDAEFVTLRTTAGMRRRMRDTQSKLIGMGRLVGDLGSFVAISDIAVHPDHQGKECGRFILEALFE